jgi:hypothetical protein
VCILTVFDGFVPNLVETLLICPAPDGHGLVLLKSDDRPIRFEQPSLICVNMLGSSRLSNLACITLEYICIPNMYRIGQYLAKLLHGNHRPIIFEQPSLICVKMLRSRWLLTLACITLKYIAYQIWKTLDFVIGTGNCQRVIHFNMSKSRFTMN